MGGRTPVKRSRTGLALLLLCATLLSLWGLVAAKEWQERGETLARSKRDIQNLAHSLAQHAVRSFENASIILKTIADRAEDNERPDSKRFHELLASYVKMAPQIRELVV